MTGKLAPQPKHKPLRILQVFHRYAEYGKEEHRSHDRSALTKWHSPIVSTSGFHADGVLSAPETMRDLLLASNAADTVVLNDYHSTQSRDRRIPDKKRVSDSCDFLSLKGAPHTFEIFTLRWSTEGFELWLDYQKNSGYIGRPRRDDFKIAHLEQDRAVRVTINGKFDFSLSGRKARTYAERDYFFCYLGAANDFEFLEASTATSQKPVPQTEAKHVDLRAVLY